MLQVMNCTQIISTKGPKLNNFSTSILVESSTRIPVDFLFLNPTREQNCKIFELNPGRKFDQDPNWVSGRESWSNFFDQDAKFDNNFDSNPGRNFD